MYRKSGRHYSGLCTLHQYYFTAGGKPSTWFPPEGLVEQNFRARNLQKNWILNLVLSFRLFFLFFFLQKWLSHLNDEMSTPNEEQYSFEMTYTASLVLYFRFWYFIFDFVIGYFNTVNIQSKKLCILPFLLFHLSFFYYFYFFFFFEKK